MRQATTWLVTSHLQSKRSPGCTMRHKARRASFDWGIDGRFSPKYISRTSVRKSRQHYAARRHKSVLSKARIFWLFWIKPNGVLKRTLDVRLELDIPITWPKVARAHRQVVGYVCFQRNYAPEYGGYSPTCRGKDDPATQETNSDLSLTATNSPFTGMPMQVVCVSEQSRSWSRRYGLSGGFPWFERTPNTDSVGGSWPKPTQYYRCQRITYDYSETPTLQWHAHLLFL